jgi:transcriptional regulator with XRE-family HTH domain
MTLGNRIRNARLAARLTKTALAARVGVSRTAVGQWEKDESVPRKDNILAMAKELGVPPHTFDLFGGGNSVTHLRENADRKLILLLHWNDLRHVRGGKVSMTALLEHEYIEGDSLISSESFAVKLEDESMEPTFYRGDIVVLDPAVTTQDTDCVLVRLRDSPKHVFRHYVPRRGGAFDLVAENPEFPTVTSNSSTQVEVLGVMVEHRRKRRIS